MRRLFISRAAQATRVTVKPAVLSVDDTGLASPLYRAVWRWHFFAGLICLPFLTLMAVTGALYLFNIEIESIVYRDLYYVTPASHATSLSPEQIVAKAVSPTDKPIRYVPPTGPDRSAEVGVSRQGQQLSVYLDPYTGRKLGELKDSSKLMQVVKQLHSLTIAGRLANYWIEIVAGWAIVLVVTGVFLWWPRGRTGGLVTVRSEPAKRLWWRDLHAVTGVFAAAVILFLAVTGMPWSAFWGQQFGALTNRLGIGLPVYVWGKTPQSTIPMSAQGTVPWTLSQATVPLSTATPTPSPIGLNQAVAQFAQLGLSSGYRINLPSDAQGVYTAMLFPQDVRQERVVHLDQYSGRPLIDVSYADYGIAGKATEWGVSLHTGKQFGRINQLIMLAGCLAIIALAVTSLVMWWKRRPKGQLGAPTRQPGKRIATTALGIAIALGLLYPLLGASMLVAASIEYLIALRGLAADH